MKPLSFPRSVFLLLALISGFVLFITITLSLVKTDISYIVEENYLYLGGGSIHLFLLSVSLFFLWQKDFRSTLDYLGVNLKIKEHALFTLIGMACLFTILFWLQIAVSLVGFNDQHKVQEKVVDLPLSMLLLAVVGAPFTEELFFRAFLVNRFVSMFSSMSFSISASSLLAIVFSSLMFGLLHFSYGSVVEIVGVFVIGMLLAAIYRISNSIIPPITMHLIYNFLSILAMKMMV